MVDERLAPRRDAIADVALIVAAFCATRALLGALAVPFTGPITVAVSVAAICAIQRWRGRAFVDLGLSRPNDWGRVVAVNLFTVGAVAVVYLAILEPLLDALGLPAGHENRFSYLEGDALALILSLVFIAWGTAGFGEEILARGFLFGRLERAFGGSRAATLGALVAHAALFGLAHFGSGPRAVIAAAVIGVILGAAFLAGRRNLWCVIPAHAIVDTISLVQIYGGN